MPTDQEMITIGKLVCYSQFLGGKGIPHHATWRSTRVGQETEGAIGKHGRSLYCDFCGKEQQNKVNRSSIG